MLGPAFEEGKALANCSIVEIPLPDDDADAMLMLCSGLQFRDGRFLSCYKREGFCWRSFRQVAMLADKYACCDALAPAAQAWFDRYVPMADSRSLRELLISAHYFDHDAVFEQVSKRLIMTSQGTVWDGNFSLDREDPRIFDKVFRELMRLFLERGCLLKLLIQKY